MEIMGHLIPNQYIVGIGPLLREEPPLESASALLYGSIRFSFDLHLANHTVIIRSDWFHPKDNKAEQGMRDQWKAEYHSIRTRVAIVIGEVTKEREEHLELVEKAHASIISLIEELQPDITHSTSSTLKLHRLIQEVKELSGLAKK